MYSVNLGCTLCVCTNGFAQMYSIRLSSRHYFKQSQKSHESLNEVTQTSEIDLFVKLWDGADKCVKVMHYCFTFLGHGRHTDILNHYVEMTKGLKLEYFCQISMDDPTVNMKFFESFLPKLKNENYHSLVDIGGCSPHCAVISRAKYQDFLIVLWGKQTVLSTMQCLDCLYWSW